MIQTLDEYKRKARKKGKAAKAALADYKKQRADIVARWRYDDSQFKYTQWRRICDMETERQEDLESERRFAA